MQRGGETEGTERGRQRRRERGERQVEGDREENGHRERERKEIRIRFLKIKTN